MNDELWGLTAGSFGNDDPCEDIDNKTGTKGQAGKNNPDQTDDRGIDLKVLADPRTDSPKHPALHRAVQFFHRKG